MIEPVLTPDPPREGGVGQSRPGGGSPRLDPGVALYRTLAGRGPVPYPPTALGRYRLHTQTAPTEHRPPEPSVPVEVGGVTPPVCEWEGVPQNSEGTPPSAWRPRSGLRRGSALADPRGQQSAVLVTDSWLAVLRGQQSYLTAACLQCSCCHSRQQDYVVYDYRSPRH